MAEPTCELRQSDPSGHALEYIEVSVILVSAPILTSKIAQNDNNKTWSQYSTELKRAQY